MSKPTEVEAARYMADAVNNMSFKGKEFAQEMGRQHRTLQQNFTRACVAWLEHLAEMEKAGRFDLRNEDSCKLARKIIDTTDERDRYLSYV